MTFSENEAIKVCFGIWKISGNEVDRSLNGRYSPAIWPAGLAHKRLHQKVPLPLKVKRRKKCDEVTQIKPANSGSGREKGTLSRSIQPRLQPFPG